jgi:hypothetical protein
LLRQRRPLAYEAARLIADVVDRYTLTIKRPPRPSVLQAVAFLP